MSDQVKLIRSCTARLKVVEHDVRAVVRGVAETRLISLDLIEAVAELSMVAGVLDHQLEALLPVLSLGSSIQHGKDRTLAAVQLGSDAACASCSCSSCAATREDAEATAAQMVAAAAARQQ